MDIQKEQSGQLEAIIRVKLGEEDYREQVEKELKNVQKKAQMPGFRPGKVPLGLVRKMYGKSVLAEEVNKILADAVFEYIKENEINVLGNPIPDNEKVQETDWENQKEFEFEYHVGLAPEITLELSKDIAVDYHRVQVGDDVVEKYVEDLRKRYGKMTNPGVSGEEDVLFGEFAELDQSGEPKPGGHVHKANVYLRYISDEKVRKGLTGRKPGEQEAMDVRKAVGSDAEAAAMVGLKKEQLDEHGPVFRFTIESISRVEPAELDKELFAKAAPEEGIETEDAFRQFVKDQIGKQYQVDADKHFMNLVKEKLLDLTNLELPEEFLKKWLLDTNKEELTEEKIEEEFDQFSDSFRWQLLENHLIKNNGLEVNPEEVNSHLEGYVKAQLRQYGQDEVPQDLLDQYVKNIASNKDEVKKVYDHLFEQKLLALFKEKLTLKEVDISYDDFVRLVTKKYEKETDRQNEKPAKTDKE